MAVTMPYRARGKEVQVLRSAGWRTLEVYESRAVAKKHLLALLRSYADKQRPPPVSSPQEESPVVEVKRVIDTPETPITTPVGTKGPGAWHLAAEKYWVSLDADFKPWVAWRV
jgi:hypothetical protein